jgi:dihydrofolate synthase/folylpolyglutamate synthase
MKFSNFSQVEDYIFSLITDSIDIGYRAGFALDRVIYTLSLLDNPQEKIKVIHIAGTSGKGSTATFISDILIRHGFKTGLTVSPHIVDLRERIQINGKLADKEILTKYFNEIFHVLKEVGSTKYGNLTYFETIIILAFYVFHKENVDYGVIETGLGGLYDATNCVSNESKLAVITRIGYDHTHILGNTLEEITTNKAGIVKQKQALITLDTQSEIQAVLIKRAEDMDAEIRFVSPDGVRSWLNRNNFSTVNLPDYQIENLCLAIKSCNYLSDRDSWKLQEKLIQKIIDNFNFAGRFELINFKGTNILLDGAHNPQKMESFLDSLDKKYTRKKHTFIVAFKKDKDIDQMLKQISDVADSILITTFHTVSPDFNLKSQDAKSVFNRARNYFKGDMKVYDRVEDCIEYAVARSETTPIIVTGSLYLVGEAKYYLSSKLPQ